MKANKISWGFVIGAGVIAGLFLVALAALVFWLPNWPGGLVGQGRFETNGERIYFTATSRRGTEISAEMPFGPGRMRGMRMRMTCASCHGPDGRGGNIRMMMETVEVPDIRYQTLTAEGHGDHDDGHDGEEGEEHEAYTEETLKQAITEGIAPDGEPLDWPMPRWTMSEEDLDDLIDFLKTLDEE
jgi:hypothetical protein